jgi:mannose-6-phosphate isomerase-like protein (cupin superfamily)
VEATNREDAVARWRPYSFFHGYTANVEAMESHLSVLSAGHSPHRPHAHVEEELLVVLDGVAEILITDDDRSEGRVEVLGPGSFVYHPAYRHHTIRNRTDAPITYVMFKWQSCPLEVEAPLPSHVFHRDHPSAPAGSDPFFVRVVLEGPTAYLTKLHAHQTALQPGCGYAAHVDEHDVAIIVVSGKIRTAGKEVGPRGVVFFPAGERHGMHNPGPETAHYLVFEFHAPAHGEDKRIGRSLNHWMARAKNFLRRQNRLVQLKRWVERRLKHLMP